MNDSLSRSKGDTTLVSARIRTVVAGRVQHHFQKKVGDIIQRYNVVRGSKSEVSVRECGIV